MGIAASSALRDDTGANGPAYGSLEGLGGPRVLKKKPVLVLDPEELEAAHALFYEASAELLGEDVERAPRPVSILGLAPMEDDPEELGHSDEVDDDAEDDLPSPEAVLALTRRKTPLPELDYAEEGYGEEGYADEGYADEGYADDTFGAPPDGQDGLPDPGFIDDGLDLSTRIFPSLPIRQDIGDDDLEDFTFQPVELARPASVTPLPVPPAAPPAHVARAPEPPFAAPPAAPAAPVAVPTPSLPEILHEDIPPVEADLPVDPAAPVADVNPAPKAPLEDLEELEDLEVSPSASLASQTPPAARFEERDPVDADETPAKKLDLQSWLAWEAEDDDTPPPAPRTAPQVEAELDAEPRAELQPDLEAELELDLEAEWQAEKERVTPAPAVEYFDEEDDGQNSISDDKVDGYAFMRDQRPRRAVLQAAQEGQQSALRAKLLRDAERDAAHARRPEPQQRPLVAMILRCWNWLRGLMG